ncbi:hypothetical protein FD754_016968, partial [Muntiacus muntjak]
EDGGPGRRREEAYAASSRPGPGPRPLALRPDHASGSGGGGDDFSLDPVGGDVDTAGAGQATGPVWREEAGLGPRLLGGESGANPEGRPALGPSCLSPIPAPVPAPGPLPAPGLGPAAAFAGTATIHGPDLPLRSENGVLALATPRPQPGVSSPRRPGPRTPRSLEAARSCRPTSCWRSAQNLRLPQRLSRRRRDVDTWKSRCPVATCNKLFPSKHSVKTHMAKRHNLHQDLLAQLEAANSLTPSGELAARGRVTSVMLGFSAAVLDTALASSGILTVDVASVNSALAGNLPANNNNPLGQAVDPQALMATSDLPQSLDTSLFFGTTAAGFQQGPLDMDDVSSLSAGLLASLSSLAVKNSSQEPQDLTPSNKLTVDTDALTPSSTPCENSVSELLPPTKTEWNVHPDSDFFAQEEETQFGFGNPAGDHGSQKETDLIIVTGSSFLV